MSRGRSHSRNRSRSPTGFDVFRRAPSTSANAISEKEPIQIPKNPMVTVTPIIHRTFVRPKSATKLQSMATFMWPVKIARTTSSPGTTAVKTGMSVTPTTTTPATSKNLPTPTATTTTRTSTSLPAPPIAQGTNAIMFQILPIAPASFERRRRSMDPSRGSPSPSSSSRSRSPSPNTNTNTSANINTNTAYNANTNTNTGFTRTTESPDPGLLNAPRMNRRSFPPFDSAHLLPSSASSDALRDFGGIYGWSQEEAAERNREYVEFMKSKGVFVNSLRRSASPATSTSTAGVQS
ncbi:hypothetical protein HK100_002400 [Physocladia obscura]|uniref:Uncharacterized protein n=1 Tax=Physocladia obscura TaxID=109957 RepID=A0AAD5TD41_9FUNG|nr:hypothetical protein HK100_002400 [Physocladia obscura]